VSGELTRYWHEQFSTDVVDAISHHDDGWSEWEAEPKLNPSTGVPYSFLEMPLTEALPIWDRSIAAARQFGPLAGYVVAGHFYHLRSDSDHASVGPAVAWLTAKRKVRTSWIDEWLRADKLHTLDYSKRAQQMLLVADLFSLWLCCDCPVEDNQESILTQSPIKLRTDTILSKYRFGVRECMTGQSDRADRLTGFAWTVEVDPYPFRDTLPRLSVKAIATPIGKYSNWQGIAATGWTLALDWRLVPSAAQANGQTLPRSAESG
jgi:hypothetical protein